ncbi:Cupredoxin [Artemisia annua]|uniref:Cupredoxin n=1 Tax=Artemisia annua TaxID=35608 RepID=A0A2U1KY53_ARTAN|nr:Cupredoxin [Artemisia annua]
MAAKFYNSNPASQFDTTTTTTIIKYNGNYAASPSPLLPLLPAFNDRNASFNFTRSLRSLASTDHPVDVPMKITRNLLYTLSINTLPCGNNSVCGGPQGRRFAASINNITFDTPKTSILGAYYRGMNGVYGDDFPDNPPFIFNYTSDSQNSSVQTPMNGTEVKILKYNDTVELVFQGTNVVSGIDHPMHLHGHSFYVVGSGIGNFDRQRDPLNYNLVDPPLQQTVAVPQNGWTAIRFRANNPDLIRPKTQKPPLMNYNKTGWVSHRRVSNIQAWRLLKRHGSLVYVSAVRVIQVEIPWLTYVVVALHQTFAIVGECYNYRPGKWGRLSLCGEKIVERITSILNNQRVRWCYVPLLKLPVSGYMMKGVFIVQYDMHDLQGDDSSMNMNLNDFEDKEEAAYSEAVMEIFKKHRGRIERLQ